MHPSKPLVKTENLSKFELKKHSKVCNIIDMNITTNDIKKRQIVIIHDPPILYQSFDETRIGYDDHESNQNIDSELLGKLIAQFTIPVVIILSGISGKEEVNYICEKCIGMKYRSMINLEIVYCNPIPPRSVIKVLKNIAVKEGLCTTKIMNDKLTETIDYISISCQGDVR
jgi:hypothetical protein